MPARTLRSIARTALHSLGIVHAVRASRRRSCRVLLYHRFPEDQSQLIAQCEHIRRYYNPVPMCRVADALRSGNSLPHNAIAITVDDGFRDFLTNAQPVFSKYGIPSTVFVVTDFLDRKIWPWFSKIEYMIARTSSHSIQFLGRELIIRNDRLRVAVRMTDVLTGLTNVERMAEMEALEWQLGIEVPADPPPEHEALTWDEVRRLAAEGVEFGSHTRTHPVLSRVSGMAELQQEIDGSKRRLDEELQVATLHFSYPFGRHADFNDQTVALVRRSGFVTAATAERGFNDARSDPFRLTRVGVDPAIPERKFVELLAGVRKH